jgi:hypothetical protein
VAASAAIFVGVTCLTGGLAAPVLASIAAAGWTTTAALIPVGVGAFASGLSSYLLGSWLNHRPASVAGALGTATLSTAITLGTLGLGRFLLPPSVLVAMGSTLFAREAVNTGVGATLAAGTKVVSNGIQGRDLDDHLGEAVSLGALNGALLEPLRAMVPVFGASVAGADPAPHTDEVPPAPAPPPPAKTGGLVELLDAAPRDASPPTADPLLDAADYLRDAPSLAADIAGFKASGELARIRYGEPGRGTYWEPTTKEIVFDPASRDPTVIGQGLAHEVGHIKSPSLRPAPTWAQTPTRREFVDAQVRWLLKSEGDARLNEVRISREVTAAPSWHGVLFDPKWGEYSRIYDDPSLSYEDKVDRIATIMAGEQPSTWSVANYEWAYGNQASRQYDALVASHAWPGPVPENPALQALRRLRAADR